MFTTHYGFLLVSTQTANFSHNVVKFLLSIVTTTASSHRSFSFSVVTERCFTNSHKLCPYSPLTVKTGFVWGETGSRSPLWKRCHCTHRKHTVPAETYLDQFCCGYNVFTCQDIVTNLILWSLKLSVLKWHKYAYIPQRYLALIYIMHASAFCWDVNVSSFHVRLNWTRGLSLNTSAGLVSRDRGEKTILSGIIWHSFASNKGSQFKCQVSIPSREREREVEKENEGKAGDKEKDLTGWMRSEKIEREIEK